MPDHPICFQAEFAWLRFRHCMQALIFPVCYSEKPFEAQPYDRHYEQALRFHILQKKIVKNLISETL